MRIRKILPTTALVAALVTSTTLVSLPSRAQMATFLQPDAAGWAVSKMGAGENAYCALARRFEQNTVMTFARNANDEGSFAIDFQKPVFQTGQTVELVLDPGAGQQRAYTVKPVSAQAFVARMGRDASFFSSLEKTGVLRVEMNGKSYHFNVSDVQAGQTKLDSCVVSMVMPAAGDEMGGGMDMAEGALTPAPSPAAPSGDVSGYKAEINSLRREVKALKAKNESMTTPDIGGNAEAQMLSKRIESLATENQALQKKLDIALEPRVETVLPEGASPELTELRQENLRLKAELQTANPEASNVAEYKAQLETLKSENRRLQTALSQVPEGNTQDSSQLNARLSELETQNAELSQKLAEASEKASQVTSSSPEEGLIARLQSENADLKANLAKKGVDADLLAQLRQQIGQVENENRLLEQTAAQIKTDLSQEHLSEIAELKAQHGLSLAQLRDETSVSAQTASADVAELSALQDEVESLKDLNLALQKQVSEGGQADTQLASLKSEMEQLELKNIDLTKRVASFEAAKTEVSTESAAQIALLTTQNAELEKRLEELANNDGVELAALKNENEKLQADLIAKAEIQSKYDALLAENESLNGKLGQLAELEGANTALAEALEKNKKLQSSLKDVITLAETYKADAEAAQSLAVSQGEADAEAEAEAAQSKVASLSEEVKSLKVENSELKSQIAGASQISTSSEDVALGAEEKTALERKIASLQSEIKTITAQREKESAQAQRRYAELEEKLYEAGRDAEPVTVAAAPMPQPTPAPIAMAEAPPARVSAPQERVEAEPVAPEVIAEPEDAVEIASAETPVADAPPVPRAAPKVNARRDYRDGLNPEDIEGLTQAQIQELQLKRRGLQPEEPAVVAEAPQAPIAPLQEAAPAPAPVQASMAQDPFEDLSVSADEAYADIVAQDRRADAQQQAQETVAEIQQQEQALQPADMALPEAPVEQAEAPYTPPSAPAADVYQPTFSVADVLQGANAVVPGSFEMISEASNAQRVAYQWVTPTRVFASAEQRGISSPSQFDDLVQEYLERTQSRCPGEYAIVPDSSTGDGDARVDSYEVACVAGAVNSSASLLFFAKGGTFTAMAYEAPTSEMDNAIDNRNKILQIVKGPESWNVASR